MISSRENHIRRSRPNMFILTKRTFNGIHLVQFAFGDLRSLEFHLLHLGRGIHSLFARASQAAAAAIATRTTRLFFGRRMLRGELNAVHRHGRCAIAIIFISPGHCWKLVLHYGHLRGVQRVILADYRHGTYSSSAGSFGLDHGLFLFGWLFGSGAGGAAAASPNAVDHLARSRGGFDSSADDLRLGSSRRRGVGGGLGRHCYPPLMKSREMQRRETDGDD
mmetsp:Transcript_30690/g.64860  ORF Transcript_30690/g.64860 Transcript_30690/m.64860 type:complete len:221 (+) Transcript_30690:1134-1796(+)